MDETSQIVDGNILCPSSEQYGFGFILMIVKSDGLNAIQLNVAPFLCEKNNCSNK